MVIGIISEGKEDFAVIEIILETLAKNNENIVFSEFEVYPIRPSLFQDETDLSDTTIGTFQGVKNACESKTELDMFLSIVDNEYIVIHLDTAEIDNHDFVFQRPNKNEDNYSTELRNLVIEIINEWLENSHKENLFYALAIEEIESWCLTVFENKDTTSIINSKEKLSIFLEKNNLTAKKLKCNPNDRIKYFQKFLKKKEFHKIKELEKYATKNQSMRDFIESIKNEFDKL